MTPEDKKKLIIGIIVVVVILIIIGTVVGSLYWTGVLGDKSDDTKKSSGTGGATGSKFIPFK